MSKTDVQQKTLLDVQPPTDAPEPYAGPYEMVIEDTVVVPENDLWFHDACRLADWFAEDVDRLLGAVE